MTMNSAYYELRADLQSEIDKLQARNGNAERIITLKGTKELELVQDACVNLFGVEYLDKIQHNDNVYIMVKLFKEGY